MAGKKDAPGIAAILRGMGVDKGQRRGRILDKAGIFHLRIEPVVGHHRHQPCAGEGLAEGQVVRPVAPLPAPAIEEQHHRCGRRQARRHIDVELLAGVRSIGQAALDAVAGAWDQQVDDGERRNAPGERANARRHQGLELGHGRVLGKISASVYGQKGLPVVFWPPLCGLSLGKTGAAPCAIVPAKSGRI